jgi:hypothetical protein
MAEEAGERAGMDLVSFYSAVNNNRVDEIRESLAALEIESANKRLEQMGEYYGFKTFWDPEAFDGYRVMLGQDLANVMYKTRDVSGVGQLLRSYSIDLYNLTASEDNLRTLLKAHFGLAKTVSQVTFATWKHFLLCGMKGETEEARKVSSYLLEMEQQGRVHEEMRQSSGLNPEIQAMLTGINALTANIGLLSQRDVELEQKIEDGLTGQAQRVDARLHDQQKCINGKASQTQVNKIQDDVDGLKQHVARWETVAAGRALSLGSGSSGGGTAFTQAPLLDTIHTGSGTILLLPHTVEDGLAFTAVDHFLNRAIHNQVLDMPQKHGLERATDTPKAGREHKLPLEQRDRLNTGEAVYIDRPLRIQIHRHRIEDVVGRRLHLTHRRLECTQGLGEISDDAELLRE